MYSIRNVSELTKQLNKNSNFIEAIFDSNNRQMDIANALDRVSEETLDNLESMGFIEIYRDTVMLDENMAAFFESMLVDGYESDLSDYDEIFKKLKNQIELYYSASSANSDASRHVNAVHRILRKMPKNLVSTLDSLRKQVEFTYKSTQQVEIKLQELSSYKESLHKLNDTIDKINHNLSIQSSFFSKINDAGVTIQYIRLKDYLKRINNSLLQIMQEVVLYITKVELNAEFHQHISNMKELISKKELIENSNIEELVGEERTILASGFNVVTKKNRNIKPHPDLVYDDAFVRLIVGASDELDIKNTPIVSEPIPNEMLDGEESENKNYIFAVFDFIESESDATFLEYLREWDVFLQGKELLGVYLELITSDNDGLIFTEEEEQIDGYLCATMKREQYKRELYAD